ncbi:hypothetical protein RIR_jg18454.t1 [Rhizophagus irregularis DAOM 181602=DAOM 197198]|nr:hypothetical protein RIR_jg18454.t1 [Rhizophagus irregularis DAOM 181602=DAOM 197198]
MNSEQGKRGDEAKLLYDDYKKVEVLNEPFRLYCEKVLLDFYHLVDIISKIYNKYARRNLISHFTRPSTKNFKTLRIWFMYSLMVCIIIGKEIVLPNTVSHYYLIIYLINRKIKTRNLTIKKVKQIEEPLSIS